MKASERIREMAQVSEEASDKLFAAKCPTQEARHVALAISANCTNFSLMFRALAILAELIEGGGQTPTPSMRSALQVIHTWASVQLSRPEQHVLDAQDVLNLCEKTLKEPK